MKVIKFLLLLSAASLVITRLFSHNNAAYLDENTLRVLTTVSIVSGVICVICTLIWAIDVKKQEKAEKKDAEDTDA